MKIHKKYKYIKKVPNTKPVRTIRDNGEFYWNDFLILFSHSLKIQLLAARIGLF